MRTRRHRRSSGGLNEGLETCSGICGIFVLDCLCMFLLIWFVFVETQTEYLLFSSFFSSFFASSSSCRLLVAAGCFLVLGSLMVSCALTEVGEASIHPSPAFGAIAVGVVEVDGVVNICWSLVLDSFFKFFLGHNLAK